MSQIPLNNKLKAVYIALVLVLIALVAGFNMPEYEPQGFVINIQDQRESHFINQFDVEKMISDIRKKDTTISRNEHFSLKDLEDRLRAMEFVREAEVSRDLKGNLIVDVLQDEPVARIITERGNGGYITQDKEIISLSDHYTSRVLILTGDGADSLFVQGFFETEKGVLLYEMIDFINHHPIWSLQISQIDLNPQLEITMYPQVGKQRIEMGAPVKFKDKFKKLELFYKQIVPYKGWNAYDKIKLQYDDQIVCEK
jgi:cell division protein FtsQ